MSDDPGLNYIASQKSISDARSARGVEHPSSLSNFADRNATETSGGGGSGGLIGGAIYWLIVGSFWLMWQGLKLFVSILGIMFSRRR